MRTMRLLKTERDLERLQGSWRFLSGQRKARLEVRDDLFEMEFADGTVYSGTVALDPAARPHAMDLRIDDGPPAYAGKVALSIYRFDGDHLIWSPGDPGSGQRPESFPPKGDLERLCLVFVRDQG